MKKLSIFISIILLAVSLSGCAQNPKSDITLDNDNEENDTSNIEPGITGYVMDKENGGILVVDQAAQDFSSNGGLSEYYEAIWFSNAPDDINVGEQVKVWFDAVRESYPAQSDIEKIEVIQGQKPDGAKLSESEALYKALTSSEINTDFFLIAKSVEYDKESHEWNIQLKEIQGDKVYDIIVEDSDTTEVSDNKATPAPFILDDDLELGALKVKMTRQMIDEVMQVELSKSEKDDSSSIASEFLYYDDQTIIHLVEGEIYSITVVSADYATPRGLKVGASVDELQRLYGEPADITEEGIWIYSPRGYDLFYVTIQDDKVVSIKVSLVM